MLSNDPEMSVETANQFIEMSKGFYTPISMALTTIIVSLIFGFIVSLIGGLIVKKSNQNSLKFLLLLLNILNYGNLHCNSFI